MRLGAKTMLILLDTERRLVLLYTQYGVRTFNISEVNAIRKEVGDSNLLYVTSAREVDIEDVVGLLQQVSVGTSASPVSHVSYGVLSPSPLRQPQSDTEGPLFVHMKNKGYLYINDINVVFTGPQDLKPITEFGGTVDEMFANYPQIKQLVKQGALEVINSVQGQKAIKQFDQTTARDKGLDSILINSSVKDFQAGGGGDKGFDDAIQIDLG